MRCPPNRTTPPDARAYPLIRLNAVVLPAPFGPISAVIEPRSTSNVAPSTAATPPKCFASPSTSRIGASLKGELLAFPEQSLRPEGHQQHQEGADDDQSEVGAVGGAQIRNRRKAEKAGRCVEHAVHDRARCNAPVVGGTTEDDDHERDKRRQRVEVERSEEAELERVQQP